MPWKTLTATALLALLAPLLALPSGAAETSRGAELPAVPARQANDLVHAFGVQTHLAYPGTPYQDVARVKEALVELGVRHVRDQLYAGKPALYDAMEEIASAGIRFNVLMGNPISWETPELLVHTLAQELPRGVVESLEGANEWNLKGRAGWARELREHQRTLYETAKAHPATAHLPVLAPALGMRTGFEALGDLTGYADLGNVHVYPGGRSPVTWILQLLAAALLVVPEEPVMVTEGGYHNAMNTGSGHHPTPEDVVGVYAPRQLLEHFWHGSERFYIYELLDERPDPELRDHEAHFGLLRHDFSPKPAYVALRNLLRLADDPGPAFEPEALAYDVRRAPSDLREVLLQRRDGDFVLLLWRDVEIYDRVREREVPVEPRTVRVRLAERTQVRVHRPSVRRRPVASTTARRVSVPLSGDVVALRISGDGPVLTAPGRPRRVRADVRGRGVVVRWLAPRLDGGAPIRRYRVVERRTGKVVAVAGDTHRVQVRCPRGTLTARFAVRARNEVGLGRARTTAPIRLR